MYFLDFRLHHCSVNYCNTAINGRLFKKKNSIKGTVSRDWGELLMVETDKAHFFNVAGARLFLNLTTFS